jgi:hypothetical protein
LDGVGGEGRVNEVADSASVVCDPGRTPHTRVAWALSG